MSERTTKKQVVAQFERLLAVLGKRRARGFGDVGGWRLDYQPDYGGIVIEEIDNTGGGVSHPIMERRLPPREFVTAIHFTIRAIEASRRR